VKRLSKPGVFLWLLIILFLAAWIAIAPRIYSAISSVWNAQQALVAGEPAQAARGFASAAEIIPWRTHYWEQAGLAALEAGEAPSAVTYFSKAASQGNLSPGGTLALGDACQQVDDVACATQWWEAALHAGISPADIYTRLLPLHRQQADYPRVLTDLNALAELQPENAGWQYQLGLVLAASQPEDALPYLSRAGELDPSLEEKTEKLAQNIRIARLKEDPAFTLLEAGRALGLVNEWALAYEAFQRAAEIRPDYAEAWAYLAEARQQLGDDQAAGGGLAELERALQIDPSSLSAHMFMSLYWQRQGQLERALMYMDEAISLYPVNPALHTERGRILAQLGYLSAAQQAYEQAIRLAPQDATYYRLLAAFALAHNYQLSQTGLPAARRALLLSPNDPASPDMLGQVLFELGDASSAKRFFEQALLLQPQYAPALLHLGLIDILENNLTAAHEKLNLVLTLAPGTSDADQAQRLLDYYFP
jgi:tetratricopeptide (TPR) repeat protein